MDNPSQHEANKMLRVLNGAKLKYTARVTMPNGSVLEFQTNKTPSVKWSEDSRSLWLRGYAGDDSYEGYPIMQWIDGSILQCEENPK